MLNGRQNKHLSVCVSGTATVSPKREPGESWRERWGKGCLFEASPSMHLPKQEGLMREGAW